jgi:hypothetical protein
LYGRTRRIVAIGVRAKGTLPGVGDQHAAE